MEDGVNAAFTFGLEAKTFIGWSCRVKETSSLVDRTG